MITLVIIYMGNSIKPSRIISILTFQLCDHCFSYIIAFYRAYDIIQNGQIDINGIKRAPMESFIGLIQFFISCILIGFTINHYFDPENQKSFNHYTTVLQNYWIIIDMIIVFLSQSYISTSLYMKVNGEVAKNIYTLHFL
jgi:hypothetical protein